MKLKFVNALLDECETLDEIDDVFDFAEYDLFSERCSLLEEKVKCSNLPHDTRIRYGVLKQAYINKKQRSK